MKNILLPTDFSENSWNAIQYAIELFKDKKCNFFLLNTYNPVIYDVEFMETNTAKLGLINAMRQTSENKIDKVQEKVEKQFKNRKHIFSKISSFSTLTREIEALYEGDVIDFIVMGTKGATGLTKILFGSNTVDVIKNAKCPVLAVPSNFIFKPPNEMLFPSDYEVSFNKKIVDDIIDIAKTHHSRVNILNASDGYNLSKKQENNKKKLEELFKNVAHIFHNDRNDNIIESITNFQLKVPVNLLVMINNKNSFFEKLFFKSVINQIGFHSNVPFLVIPSSG
jgi:nucleotide-binding universal stress UspA family protein